MNIISLKKDTGIGLLAFAEQYAFAYLLMFPQGAFNLKKNPGSNREVSNSFHGTVRFQK